MNKQFTGISADERRRQLEELDKMTDADIDTSDPDAPVLPPEKWAKGVVGKFYRPKQELVAINLDSDVLAWLKSQPGPYQTRINGILRDAMASARKS